MTRKRITIITLGVMLSMFMAAMEATAVATAMPTIVTQLGGLSNYSWVFSAYMLTSTVTIPIYGKLSDIFGRRAVYTVTMGRFLAGSAFSGQAQTMEQLVAFRALQGLGAGGLLPMAFTIIADLFSLEQRARMTGLFAGVWAISSIVGPLLGGFLADQLSWRWVCYVNILPGLLAATVVWMAWQDRRPSPAASGAVDVAGALILTVGITALLLALFTLGTPAGWALLAVAVGLLLVLIWIEKRAHDPMLSLILFRDKLFAVACGHGVLTGWSMLGSLSFLPLYTQAILGTSATAVGAILTLLLLTWVLTSVVGNPLLLHVSFRTLALAGMSLLVVGTLLMARADPDATTASLVVNTILMGMGMGLTFPTFLIAVQNTVRRRGLGTATSAVQFSRNIGGALGVSVMGAVLSTRLSSSLTAAGLDPAAVSVDGLLDPATRGTAAVALEDPVRVALATSIQSIFFIAFAAAALGLLVTVLIPPGRVAQLAAQRADPEKVEPSALSTVARP